MNESNKTKKGLSRKEAKFILRSDGQGSYDPETRLGKAVMFFRENYHQFHDMRTQEERISYLGISVKKQKGEEMKTIKNTQKLYFYGYNFDDGEYPTIFRASVSEKGKLRGYFWHSNPDLRYSSFWSEHFISEMENECLGFFLTTPGRNDTTEWKRREIVIQDCISRTAQ